jgi:HAMP domain-containing protein
MSNNLARIESQCMAQEVSIKQGEVRRMLRYWLVLLSLDSTNEKI